MFTISDNTKHLITLALREDIGNGDVTTLATVAEDVRGIGYVKAKAPGVLCGQTVFAEVFQQVDPGITLTWLARDGDALKSPMRCVNFNGNLRSVLTAERTALNFLQRLSGVATLTRRYVELVASTSARIIDTRKTTPLWRELEKYAVQIGGGANHRMGLYDMVLIKDNHITAAGGVAKAIRLALDHVRKESPLAIEVETKNFDEVKEAVQFPIRRIMLDNMSLDEMKRCVAFIEKRVEVEASGGVTADTVLAIAGTGVDFISVGVLTHSAPALDLSLIIE